MPHHQGDVLSDTPHFDGLEDEAFPALPPPFSPGQGGNEDRDPFGNEDEDGDGDVSKLAEVPAAKRKGVKRPQPKLDSQRLISERGLPALRTLFDNVHFKGKGHEAEDLRLLMRRMENWAHRLFPKMQFDDFIDKVERLGSKKEVQTCLNRIRMDMPLTHEDFIGDEEEAAAPEPMNTSGSPDPFDDLRGPIHSTPAPAATWSPLPAPSQPAAPPSLTEEQRRRMELNRQRALEKKLARQQQQQQQTGLSHSQTVGSPTSADEPMSVTPATVLDNSTEQGEDLDLEPVSSSTQQPPPPQEQEQPSQSPRQDSELPSPQRAREEEASLSPVSAQQQLNAPEDGE